MRTPRTLLRASWLLASPGEPALADGWVLVRGARVEALGAGEAPPEAEGAARVELEGAMLVPGLTNAHAHVDYGVFRAHQDGQPFLPWIRALNERKAADFDAAAYQASARLSCLELVAGGVTSVCEATDPGVSAADALVESGLKAVCFQEEFGPDPAQAPEALARLEAKLDALGARTEGTRVRVGVSPHAPYTLSDALLEGMVAQAAARGLPLSIHVAESEAEVAFVRDGEGPFAAWHRGRDIGVRARGVSPYRHLVERGALDGAAPVLLAHGVQLGEDDLADLAGRPEAWLVHCPRSNARLGVGVAPIRAALDAGVRVALGTDGACSSDRLDMFEEMRAALWLARAQARDPGALRASEVFAMSLSGGAALSLSPGRVAAGEAADLVALDLGSAHATPPPADARAPALLASTACVRLTMVDGEVLYRDGVFTRVDPDEVLGQARALGATAP